jgi:UDP-glucuronate 4-epimerase
MKFLLTGCAGFIGYHLSRRLIELGHHVVGIDNLNSYYDLKYKLYRLENLGINIEQGRYEYNNSANNFCFHQASIQDKNIESIFIQNKFDCVINLAAQAGVRYSFTNPEEYITSNISGFNNIIDLTGKYGIKRIIYASSSSVYGNRNGKFSENDEISSPESIYAATKISNEQFARIYSKKYDISSVGLRFFTVYGPYGRPDMAYFSFVQKILKGEEIEVFNYGNLKRDFTYIDDIINSIVALLMKDEFESRNEILNIGNSNPVNLLDFIGTIEEKLGKKAKMKYLEMQLGDVYETYANTDKLNKLIGTKPNTPLNEGISKFVDWYLNYHNQ